MLQSDFLLLLLLFEFILVFCLCIFSPTCFFVLIVLAFSLVFNVQHTTQISMLPAGFEPSVSSSERPYTLTLDRSATGIDSLYRVSQIYRKVRHATKDWR